MSDTGTKKPRILYFYVKRSTFIGRDIDMLSDHYEVLEHSFHVRHKALLPFAFLSQLWFLVRNARNAKATLTHIAGYASFLPALLTRLFSVRSVIIIAGTDGARFPSISYGNFNKGFMGWFTKKSYAMASHLAPVDASLVDVPYTYDASGAPRQGYRHFCPDVETPHTVIWYGYDASEWMFKDADRPANSFITVIAGIDSQQVFLRKGVDLLLETARLLPEARFTLVGADETNPWVKDRPLNVTIHPVTDKNGLMNLLNKHRFYMQLSLMEGFPNALCEAMLCGCIPIGSNVAAIPFIIGDTGYVLQKKNADDLAILMREAIKDSHLVGAKARDRIDKNFTTKLRLTQLRRLIDQST